VARGTICDILSAIAADANLSIGSEEREVGCTSEARLNTTATSPCKMQIASSFYCRSIVMERSTALLQAKALSIDDRIWLVQALWDSISAEPEQLQLTEAQQQELSVATRTARRVGKCYIM